MSDEPLRPARQPAPQPPLGEEEIRGSAWMIAQQAAQMVGEVGVGVGGIAGAVQVAKGMIGGSKSSGEGASPPQGQGQSQGNEK